MVSSFGNNLRVSNSLFEVINGSPVSGSNVLTVMNTGNVGIGTTTPAAKLDVVGNFNLPNTTLGGTAGVIQLGGARFAYNLGTSNTFLGTNAGNTGMAGTRNTGVGNNALFSNFGAPTTPRSALTRSEPTR